MTSWAAGAAWGVQQGRAGVEVRGCVRQGQGGNKGSGYSEVSLHSWGVDRMCSSSEGSGHPSGPGSLLHRPTPWRPGREGQASASLCQVQLCPPLSCLHGFTLYTRGYDGGFRLASCGGIAVQLPYSGCWCRCHLLVRAMQWSGQWQSAISQAWDADQGSSWPHELQCTAMRVWLDRTLAMVPPWSFLLHGTLDEPEDSCTPQQCARCCCVAHALKAGEASWMNPLMPAPDNAELSCSGRVLGAGKVGWHLGR